MPTKIIYLEDSIDQAAAVRAWLHDAGYEVEWFLDGEECARVMAEGVYDLFILDWMVPGLTGPEVMERLKIKLKGAMPPVIFTTSRDSEEDIVEVLRAGADDYIVKPFSRAVLLARLQAVLRRTTVDEQSGASEIFGRLELNHGRRQILLDGQPVTLSDRELDLAFYLFRNKERLLTREHLIKVVWALTPNVDTRTVDVHISGLRKKLLLTPEEGWRLLSIYGRGYRLEKSKD